MLQRAKDNFLTFITASRFYIHRLLVNIISCNFSLVGQYTINPIPFKLLYLQNFLDISKKLIEYIFSLHNFISTLLYFSQYYNKSYFSFKKLHKVLGVSSKFALNLLVILTRRKKIVIFSLKSKSAFSAKAIFE